MSCRMLLEQNDEDMKELRENDTELYNHVMITYAKAKRRAEHG